MILLLPSIWSTDFCNTEASLGEALNHERVWAGTPEVPRDAKGKSLCGVSLSRGEEVDKRRAIEKRFSQLWCHPGEEDCAVHKAGLGASSTHPPSHPHTHRPHLGMSVCVSTIVTVSNLEMHRGHIEEGNRNVPFNQMFQSWKSAKRRCDENQHLQTRQTLKPL